MQLQLGVQRGQVLLHSRFRLIRFGITADNGVHVNANGQMQLFANFPLSPVNDLMKLQDITIGRNLRMDGRHAASGAIVMHHQVMHTQDLVVAHEPLDDLLSQLLVGRTAQETIHRVFAHVKARFQHHQRHRCTHPAVHRPAEAIAHQHAHRHR